MKYLNQTGLKNGLARMVLPPERTSSITCVMSSLHPYALAVILTTAGGLEKGETATHAVDGSPLGLPALRLPLLVSYVLQEPFGRNFMSQSLFPRFMVYGRGNAFELSPDRANVEKEAGLCVAAAATVASRDDIDKRGHVDDFWRQVDVWH